LDFFRIFFKFLFAFRMQIRWLGIIFSYFFMQIRWFAFFLVSFFAFRMQIGWFGFSFTFEFFWNPSKSFIDYASFNVITNQISFSKPNIKTKFYYSFRSNFQPSHFKYPTLNFSTLPIYSKIWNEKETPICLTFTVK